MHMFMRVLCVSFLLIPWFVLGHTGQVSSTERESGDKGATQVLEAAIPCPAQGLLTATGTATGPRAGKGVGSHTTKGRLRPVQCS